MTLTNNFLYEVAKAINSESHLVPSHMAVGTTTVTAINTTDTVLAGEIGSRIAASNSRVNNAVEFFGTRSSTAVLASTGDSIKTAGIMTAATGGLLMSGIVVSGVTQTTNFDIEIRNTFTVNRR